MFLLVNFDGTFDTHTHTHISRRSRYNYHETPKNQGRNEGVGHLEIKNQVIYHKKNSKKM